MIDSLQPATLVTDPPRRKEGAPGHDAQGFSYALAAASIERHAAKSLEAHGARPQESAAAPSVATGDGAEAQNRRAAGREPPPSSPAPGPSAPDNGAQPVAARNASPGAHIPPQGALTAASQPPAANAATASAMKSAMASAAREAAADKMKQAAVKAPRLPSAPPALKAEFAEILAKRLEKTSIFDLRLDPPDLGRVEGRLSISDDGKSVLSLSFDSRDAYDLYSRDEQALRLALQQAGLQFDSGDFVFAFRERNPDGMTPAGFNAPDAAPSHAAYDPQFFAEWSAGALDIRI